MYTSYKAVESNVLKFQIGRHIEKFLSSLQIGY